LRATQLAIVPPCAFFGAPLAVLIALIGLRFVQLGRRRTPEADTSLRHSQPPSGVHDVNNLYTWSSNRWQQTGQCSRNPATLNDTPWLAKPLPLASPEHQRVGEPGGLRAGRPSRCTQSPRCHRGENRPLVVGHYHNRPECCLECGIMCRLGCHNLKTADDNSVREVRGGS